jgi:hypothetical protein
MKHLLLLLACASAISLGVTGAQAERLQYSQPVAGTLLAQAPVEGAPGSGQFATLCRKQCEQTFAACHNRNASDPSCSNNYNTCIQGCR